MAVDLVARKSNVVTSGGQEGCWRMIRSCGKLPWPLAPQQHAARCWSPGMVCCAAAGGNEEKKVVIVGGTGRVGSSTARALAATAPHLKLVIGGRNREKGEALASEVGNGTKFVEVDINDMNSLEEALGDADLVVHAAGPFQRSERCSVLEAAIGSKTPYVDVCDDLEHARRAKSLHEKAAQAGVPALITAGIYPGVSNIMAAELVRLAREASTATQPKRLRFSYFTAGSGGAGPTILATSFLLLGEEALTYLKGKPVKSKAYSGEQIVDFGKGVGKRSVFLLNLPEVATAHEVLNVPSVAARFGTSPFFWNWAMSALAGKDFLEDRTKVDSFVKLSDPAVRLIDRVVGERMSMRVDLECTDGKRAVGLYTHRKLSVCVGTAIAAFVAPVLEGNTQPGVWFPEQVEGVALKDRQVLLQRASKGTLNYVMNKSPWTVDSEPKEIGFGIYWE